MRPKWSEGPKGGFSMSPKSDDVWVVPEKIHCFSWVDAAWCPHAFFMAFCSVVRLAGLVLEPTEDMFWKNIVNRNIVPRNVLVFYKNPSLLNKNHNIIYYRLMDFSSLQKGVLKETSCSWPLAITETLDIQPLRSYLTRKKLPKVPPQKGPCWEGLAA